MFYIECELAKSGIDTFVRLSMNFWIRRFVVVNLTGINERGARGRIMQEPSEAEAC